jgi:hypothetical protein
MNDRFYAVAVAIAIACCSCAKRSAQDEEYREMHDLSYAVEIAHHDHSDQFWQICSDPVRLARAVHETGNLQKHYHDGVGIVDRFGAPYIVVANSECLAIIRRGHEDQNGFVEPRLFLRFWVIADTGSQKNLPNQAREATATAGMSAAGQPPRQP